MIINETISSKEEQQDISNLFDELQRVIQKEINTKSIKYDTVSKDIFYQNKFTQNTNTLGNIYISFTLFVVEDTNHSKDTTCEADFDKKEVIIRGVYYNKSKIIDKADLYSKLSHEFHHLYQYNNGFAKEGTLDNLYKNVQRCMMSNDKLLQITARVLYYTFKHEISAFSTELYNELIHKEKGLDVYSIDINSLKQMSHAYTDFIKCFSYFNTIWDNSNDTDAIEHKINQNFGIRVRMIDQRVNTAKKIYNSFFNKILRKIRLYHSLNYSSGVKNHFKHIDEYYERGYKQEELL